MTSKINIGITILVEDPKNVSLFSNGICQNVLLLRELYEKCANVGKSYLINTAPVRSSDYDGTAWEPYKQWFVSVEESHALCNLVVGCNGFIRDEDHARYVKGGIKVVKQVLGPELSMFNERVLFGANPAGIYTRRKYDAAWYSPHYERDRYFHEVRYDCPSYVANYIWDPRFIQHHIKAIQAKDPGYTGTYVPRGLVAKRISTMEPNINMVKTCTIPIVAAELLQRRAPECLDSLNVFGGKPVMAKKDLIDFVKNLEIQRAKKCFFESRYPVVWTLKTYTDIVLGHQNQNELNYLYLDAAWMGYPVVHNSPMLRELGWYYPENDAAAAADQLRYIALNFDQNEFRSGDYLMKSREFTKRYSVDNRENIRCYENLIEVVASGPGSQG